MAVSASPPIIPDHEMLRVIGRGAYGEIWLARSLTGALRAVKVVSRSTFDDERAFAREFNGMSRFEPFSRAHEGFVDILHVGRGGDFFYYIMELADDCVSGQRIDPANYEPRTLKTEMQKRSRVPVAECVETGVRLADALASLHAQGLAHRDIKPANIIFVGGAPKLADIGLVAAHGQRSFVGTEGYIPPEGPGAEGDLYSLGKVLYEISTGKDRLDFPSVNTDLTQREDKAALLLLNEVLLKACANDSAARYKNAAEMRADLLRVQQGVRARTSRSFPRWLAVLVITVLVFGAVGWWMRQLGVKSDEGLQPRHLGEAAINTEPSGALVLIGDHMARSPAVLKNLDEGKQSVRVMLPGYEPVETSIVISANGRADFGTIPLTRSKGALKLTSDPPGAEFDLMDAEKETHHGKTPATLRDLPTGRCELTVRNEARELRDAVEIARGETAAKTIEFANGTLAVSSEPAGAEIFVDGVSRGTAPLQIELPSGSHELTATYRDWPPEKKSVTVENHREVSTRFEFGFGSVKITSAPSGATVIRDGTELGRTPLLLEEIKPGAVEYELRLAGSKSARVQGTVQPEQQIFLAARLEQNLSPQPGQPWENSLGMKFVPVGDSVRFCVWETRVRDYAAFCSATGTRFEKPDFAQTDTHPAVRVSWYDAQAFCKWLTERERSGNLLEENQRYRLPTDLEWSMAAGLANETGATPEQRDGKFRDVFPWGKQWPPPAGAGNYADMSAKLPRGKFIEGFTDGFAQTAPVGSFAANPNGLFDMGGNVWEWCEEGYKGDGHARDWGVLRGGSWANGSRGELLTSYRNVVDRGERDVIYGFRCVLVSE